MSENLMTHINSDNLFERKNNNKYTSLNKSIFDKALNFTS